MKKSQPNYFAVIPANVRYDNDLPAGAKLMFGEITALSNAKGYCFASNGYFSKLYGCTKQAISKWIKQLESKGYVKIEYVGNPGKVERRVSIAIDTYQQELRGVSTHVEGVSTGVEYNNTSTSNTSDNRESAPKTVKTNRFTKPTIDQIKFYMTERRSARLAETEAEKFFDHFESNGWKVGGRTKMKDWKAAVRQWLRRVKDFNGEQRNGTAPPAPRSEPENPYHFEDVDEDEARRMEDDIKGFDDKISK